ncbi:hypothetical protein [Reyranella sp.]|uniref:hypothetical protein n=1 Tax=Reyranella sp. TaxID=1929291 RepID=UPI003C7D7E03
MSDTSGMAAVDEAAATITTAQHTAAVAAAREEGRQAGLAEAQAGSAAALTAARAEGATAERARLAGIEAAALPGHDKLITDCKADPTCTPGDAALKVNAAERAKLTAAGASIAAVETATGKVPAAGTTQPDGGQAAVPQTAEGWKAEWAGSKTLQAEHASAEAYANWMQGVADGRVRIFQGGRK